MQKTDDGKVIDWIEKQGQGLMTEYLESTDILRKESTLTLTVLLAGLGTAMSYVVANFSGITNNPVVIATAFLVAYLIVVSWVLVLKCMMIKDSWPKYNSPVNLLETMDIKEPLNTDLNVLRRQELALLQDRINWTVKRNNKTSKWLNKVRIATIFTPIFWCAIYLFF